MFGGRDAFVGAVSPEPARGKPRFLRITEPPLEAFRFLFLDTPAPPSHNHAATRPHFRARIPLDVRGQALKPKTPPAPLWSVELSSHAERLSAEERLFQTVRQVQASHDAMDIQSIFTDPLIAPEGVAPGEIQALQRSLGISLPSEYALFLSRWRNLTIWGGYAVWDPAGSGTTPYLTTLEGRQLLAVGDVWHDSDGDPLLLDVGSDPAPAFVWCQEDRRLRPLARSFSLALLKLAAFVISTGRLPPPADSRTRLFQLRRTPWWRPFLGKPR